MQCIFMSEQELDNVVASPSKTFKPIEEWERSKMLEIFRGSLNFLIFLVRSSTEGTRIFSLNAIMQT